MNQLETLVAVRSAARVAAEAGELPGFLAELERVRVEAVLAAATPRQATPDQKAPSRILNVTQAAERLGRSRSWVYRNKATMPMTRFQTGGYGFDERALERWIEGRTREAIR